MSSYKDLDAWKLGMKLATLTYSICKRLPPDERFVLKSQLLRAAISVPSNIAEGLGRRTKKDTIQFLHVSRGSLYELETLIQIVRIQQYVEEKQVSEFSNMLLETQKVLNGLIRYLDRAPLR